MTTPLQPWTGPIGTDVYLSSEPDNVLWGRLPCEQDEPLARVEAGTTLTIDTLSHEGILEDQGRDPAAFFGGYGVAEVLADAIALAASPIEHRASSDGPHVVSRPIEVAGAEPGDLLAIRVGHLLPRVPYGVVSSRHGQHLHPGDRRQG